MDHKKITLILSLVLLALSAHTVSAQTWPNKPVKIVSGLGAGSSMDLVARTIAPVLSEMWGQPVVIENRTGAAGNIAAGMVANASADSGYTMVNVPFPGGAQAMNAVIAGDTQMYLPGLPVSLPQIKANKVRPLAVTSPKRVASLPDVATVTELGYPGATTVLWYGLFAPANIPDSLAKKIAADVNKALNSLELQSKLGGNGLDLIGSTPEAFKVFVNSEIDLWAQVVKTKNLRPE